MNFDIRWKQRFQNFEKAVRYLQKSLEKSNLSDLEKTGIIKVYEFTFELAWKTVKDFLLENKLEVRFPRDTIKEGFKYGILLNGEVWLDMLEKRNLMSHTYNEANAQIAYELIENEYFKELYNLYLTLLKEV